MSFEETAARLIAEGHDRKDVCCFMSISCSDLLTEQDCQDICDAAIELVNPQHRDEVRQRWADAQKPRPGQTPEDALSNWKYACAVNWRKVRAERLVRQHNLKHPAFEVRTVDRGYCILAESDSWNLDGRDALCEHYQLQPAEAECMCSDLSVRRIDEETVIGLLGDDRDQTYWIGLAFAPDYLCEAFYPARHGFDDTAGAFL